MTDRTDLLTDPDANMPEFGTDADIVRDERGLIVAHFDPSLGCLLHPNGKRLTRVQKAKHRSEQSALRFHLQAVEANKRWLEQQAADDAGTNAIEVVGAGVETSPLVDSVVRPAGEVEIAPSTDIEPLQHESTLDYHRRTQWKYLDKGVKGFVLTFVKCGGTADVIIERGLMTREEVAVLLLDPLVRAAIEDTMEIYNSPQMSSSRWNATLERLLLMAEGVLPVHVVDKSGISVKVQKTDLTAATRLLELAVTRAPAPKSSEGDSPDADTPWADIVSNALRSVGVSKAK